MVALAGVIFRQYFLTVNIFNFDPDHTWYNAGFYDGGGNAEISNGEWKVVRVAKFVPAGMLCDLLCFSEMPDLESVGGLIFPPGFEPVTPLESVVTYFSISFTNKNQFLEGVGVGILMERDDYAQRGSNFDN